MRLNRKTKKIIFISAYVFALLIFAFLMFHWTISVVTRKRKEVIVPSIERKSLSEALEILSKSNLGIKKIRDIYDETLPAGTIVKQYPPAGMKVKEGRNIEVILSLGGETSFIPSVINMPYPEARIAIHRAGFKLGNIEEAYSLSVKPNLVISQSPLPDTIMPKGTEISLKISKGEPPEGIVLMPDFLNRDLDEAVKWAKSKELDYEILQLQEGGEVNRIIKQEPIADTLINENIKIRFYIPTPTKQKLNEIQNIYTYTLPGGNRPFNVRLVLVDAIGERVLFESKKNPGTKIEFPLPKFKDIARVRLFINNILVEEKEVK